MSSGSSSELKVPAAGGQERVDLQAVRRGQGGGAYFIVDPDQVIMMTMLIIWKIMMLRKKIMLLMAVLMMRLITFEQVARAMVGRDLPATTWSGR